MGSVLFFLKPWNSDQNQPDAPMVKDVPHLLKPCHLEPICFIDYEQSCRIRQGVSHSHGTIPLLMEGILRLLSLVTSITARIRLGVAQLFGTIKKAHHSRVFVTTCPFDCGIMQQATGLCDVALQMDGRAHDRASVEDNTAFTDLLEERLGLALIVPKCLHVVPIGVMAC